MAAPRRRVRLPRRRSDRLADLAAWGGCALALVALAAGVLVGLRIHDDLSARAAAEAKDRTPLTVVVTEDVAVLPESGGRLPAAVRWTGSDGVEHTGRAVVSAPKHAGDPVAAWVTRDGRLVPAPLGTRDVVFVTAATVGMLLLLCGLVLGGLAHLAFAGVARVRAAEWEREWAEVEPRWTGRASTG